MNFETKYLIRWGIPGWVFILFSYVTYFYYEKTLFFGTQFTITQLLGILVSLGFVGIVLGYLMHQIYFSMNWIFSKQSYKIMQKTIDIIINQQKIQGIDRFKFDPHKAYFMLEYHWQKELLLINKDRRDYITERYRYMLTTIHGLGALVVSLLVSIISVISIIAFHHMAYFPIILLAILVYLYISVLKGFRYYSDNLIFFQANFINALHDQELKQETNTTQIQNKE